MAETSPTLVDDHTVSMKSGLKDRNNPTAVYPYYILLDESQ